MKLRELWRNCGPGMVVAATGLGAGDIVAAAVAGAEFGTTLVWAVLVGGLLKFCLNEGIGRWQLVTGTTLLEGWISHLPWFITGYFFIYLVFWSFMVAAAMMAATGLAAFALWPVLSVTGWGLLHAVVAFVIIWFGAWRMLETLMKSFIALMFIAVLGCALMVLPDSPEVLAGMFRPSVPDGSLTAVLSVMGGVGGSVTLMSYGYWMQEAGWRGAGHIRMMRWDLAIAYALTALFAAAVLVLAADLRPEVVAGNNMALVLAERLVPFTGAPGKWLFLFGFWGATFSSMLGVWHGVPYLFANFLLHYRARKLAVARGPDTKSAMAERTGLEGTGAGATAAASMSATNPVAAISVVNSASLTRSPVYRWYLVALCFLPMSLLVVGRPVWIVVLYAVTGAFFMPLLAALLLYFNGKARWLGAWVNQRPVRICLWLCLLLFAWLLFTNPSA